ncbi:helix-turn-helix transcriptional regulator [Streptomyces sp. NPDC013178]|uniref:helix-turn-helix domain-containing protein n=1 Tax=Streptomyces sp. NPDC013178 TaxID=3155118 RepID=UPI0033D100F5
MTSEKRRPRPATQYGPTAATVAANVRRIRERRGLTIYALSGALEKAGRPIAASAVAKIERMERQVTVDDLMALSVVLGVSPATLLLPADSRIDTEITGGGQVHARDAWMWAWCREPLRMPEHFDEEVYDRLVAEFMLISRPLGMYSGPGGADGPSVD